MRFLRVLFYVLILGSLAVAPLASYAADPLSTGWSIIPDICKCPDSAPDFGCAIEVVHRLLNLAVSLGVVIFVLISSYAGLLWIMSPIDPHNREKGRTMLMNAVIGLLIALSAWLLVDFVMKTLYNPDTTNAAGVKWGPWNEIIADGGNECLDVTEGPTGPGPSTDGPSNTGPDGLAGTDDDPIIATPDVDLEPTTCTNSSNGLCFQTAAIAKQYSHMSGTVKTLASCIAGKVPAGRGQISSVSDTSIVSGSKTWAQCAAGQCQHSANSCHYGGRTCIGSSYALDYGDGGSDSRKITVVLEAAARQCGASVNRERDHLHVSVGGSCGCDSGL